MILQHVILDLVVIHESQLAERALMNRLLHNRIIAPPDGCLPGTSDPSSWSHTTEPPSAR
jgi:hypothetical protein